LEQGLLSPGAVLFDFKRRFKARVRADGSITAMGTTMGASAGARGSIHKIGAHVQGAPACNGWTFWHYESRGKIVPIDALRERIRSQMAAHAEAANDQAPGAAE